MQCKNMIEVSRCIVKLSAMPEELPYQPENPIVFNAFTMICFL